MEYRWGKDPKGMCFLLGALDFIGDRRLQKAWRAAYAANPVVRMCGKGKNHELAAAPLRVVAACVV
jgi:hypothetical protein